VKANSANPHFKRRMTPSVNPPFMLNRPAIRLFSIHTAQNSVDRAAAIDGCAVAAFLVCTIACDAHRYHQV